MLLALGLRFALFLRALIATPLAVLATRTRGKGFVSSFSVFRFCLHWFCRQVCLALLLAALVRSWCFAELPNPDQRTMKMLGWRTGFIMLYWYHDECRACTLVFFTVCEDRRQQQLLCMFAVQDVKISCWGLSESPRYSRMCKSGHNQVWWEGRFNILVFGLERVINFVCTQWRFTSKWRTPLEDLKVGEEVDGRVIKKFFPNGWWLGSVLSSALFVAIFTL